MVTELRQDGRADDEGTERLTQALGWFSPARSADPKAAQAGLFSLCENSNPNAGIAEKIVLKP